MKTLRWVWDLARGEVPPRPDGGPGRPALEIRILPVQGLSLAAKIMAQTWEGYVTRDEAAEFLRRARGQGRLLPFVAYLDSTPVGSTLLIIRGGAAELFGGVHVLPDFRRRGVGSAILRAALRRAHSLRVKRAYVARELSEPPSADDQAAAALYDRCGGVRRRPVVEVIYSPQCPLWAERVRRWRSELAPEIDGGEVEFHAYDLWDEPETCLPLLVAAGAAFPGWGGRPATFSAGTRTWVFVDGDPVEGMSAGAGPSPALIRRAVQTALGGESPRRRPRVAGAPSAAGPVERREGGVQSACPLAGGATPGSGPETGRDSSGRPAGVRLVPLLTGETTAGGLLPCPCPCLGNLEDTHPRSAGAEWSAVQRPAAGPGDIEQPEAGLAEAELTGLERKTSWLGSLDLPGGFYGVAALRDGRVAGMAEVYPRAVAARAGLVTGSCGDDDQVLTVACLGTAPGEDRLVLLEVLLSDLLVEAAARAPGFRHIEAWGRPGDPTGPSPYWLLDKYGFEVRESSGPVTPPESGVVSGGAAFPAGL